MCNKTILLKLMVKMFLYNSVLFSIIIGNFCQYLINSCFFSFSDDDSDEDGTFSKSAGDDSWKSDADISLSLHGKVRKVDMKFSMASRI